MYFNTEKLLIDVFDPQAGERVVVMHDLPHDEIADNGAWRERRQMAAEWRTALQQLGERRGFEVLELFTFPATGANNSDLPKVGQLGHEQRPVAEVLDAVTLALALTEYSATAPLAVFAEARADFRAASMPGVLKRMEQTALSADYREVARRCQAIHERMLGAERCEVSFSTGHTCRFDLRHREPEVDDGFLPRFKEGDRIINLPSGETFEVPYEGELDGVPSHTSGTIPVDADGETILFQVAANRVIAVDGEGAGAARFRTLFEEDPARANIAELAFGVNDKAVISGVVLEDEKAGFHWAFGRSDHLGGVFGVERFASPATVLHQDIVYARGQRIQVERAVLHHPDGRTVDIIVAGEYVV